jgi:putative membrane protein
MMFGGGMLLIWIFWIAVIVGAIWLVIYLLDPKHKNRNRRESDPQEILRMRYAKGEIDFEEFEKRRKTLMNG